MERVAGWMAMHTGLNKSEVMMTFQERRAEGHALCEGGPPWSFDRPFDKLVY